MTALELRRKIIQQLDSLDFDTLVFLAQFLEMLKTGFQLHRTPPSSLPVPVPPPIQSLSQTPSSAAIAPSAEEVQESLSIWQNSGFIGCFSAEPDFAEQSEALIHNAPSQQP